jgi:hypothetical protein
MLPVLLAIALAASPGPVDQTRAAAQAASGEVAALTARHEVISRQLSSLGDRIAQLKAGQAGKVFRSSELEAALRRSQALGEALAELTRALTQARAQEERARGAHREALAQALAETAQALEAAEAPAQQATLMDRLRALRDERAALQGAVQASPALPELTTSHDPAALRARADALRDSEDKVRAQLSAVTHELRAAQAERALDRRLRDFLDDDFDETDRRLRAQRAAAGSDVIVATPVPTSGPMGPASVPEPGAGGRESPAAATNRPQVSSFDEGLGAPGGDDLEALEAKAKALSKLADELSRKAAALEELSRGQ